MLLNSDTAELHVRFALVTWDDEGWHRRPRAGRPEGGTGVELWAWLGKGGKLKQRSKDAVALPTVQRAVVRELGRHRRDQDVATGGQL